MNRFVRRSLALAAMALFPAFAPAAAPVNPFAEGVRPTNALTPEQELKSFHLPPGFTMQLVAAEPDVHKPINIAVDAKGRLWVTSTIEYPWPVKDPNVKPRDEIKVLEIDPASGRATKVTTFADGLNIPAGVYPYKDGCIAFSIPNIWHLQDTDGDGVADKRDVLYGPFDTTRDTHGMNNSFIRGYDGMLYATHGFNNQSRITAKDGSKVVMNSGNIYRMTLDGQHVDHLANGPVNPFGLMFDSAGNLFVADCHTKPIQVVLRGAWFEHFGRPHDGLGFYPKIMGHLHGSTAIGGVVVIDDDRYPAEFRGNLLCGNPMTSRVDRDSVKWSGSTPALNEQPDFVASDDPWFRPVAFAFGPDGSIFVADFYNRIIGHYEVPLTHPGRDRTSGRIWRIVPPALPPSPGTPGEGRGEGFAGAAFPDLTRLTAEQLVKLLDHPNITARTLATDQLTDRIGKDAIAPVRAVLSNGTPRQKVHAIWTLYRLGDAKPDEIAAAAKDSNNILRAHAVRLLSELKDITPDQRQLLLGALTDADPLVRRNAADALGQHPVAEDVQTLVDLLRATDKADTHLAYVARIALRNHLAVPAIMASFTPDKFPGVDDGAINEVLPAVASPEAAAITIRQLSAGPLKAGNVNDLLKHAARFGNDAGAAAATDYAKKHVAPNNVDAQLDALKSIQSGIAERGGKPDAATRAWAVDLIGKALPGARKSEQRLIAIADLAKALNLTEASAPLAAIVRDPKAAPNIRVAAVKSVLALEPKNAPAVADLVADAAQPAALREAAAKALSEVNTDEARQSLLKPIRTAPHALATKFAVALARNPEGAATLMDAFERNTLTTRLLLEPTVKDKLAAAKIKDLDAKIATLTKNLAPASAQLDQLIAAKKQAYDPKKGDGEKGKAVFTKSCAMCHQIDGQGSVVGPQLDGIGSRGLDRILEDVVDPNRNVDPNFRYSNITMSDGDVVSGLVRGEAGQTILLVDATGKENPINKSDVKSVDVSKLSLMPTGFGEIIPAEDFNHLLAYLLSHSTAKQP